jgi:hypothetical protein
LLVKVTCPVIVPVAACPPRSATAQKQTTAVNTPRLSTGKSPV